MGFRGPQLPKTGQDIWGRQPDLPILNFFEFFWECLPEGWMRPPAPQHRDFLRFPNMLACYKTLAAEKREPALLPGIASQQWSRRSIDAILKLYAAALELRRKPSLRACSQ